MTALAADTEVLYKGPDVDLRSYPVADNVLIYKGALVMFLSGYLVPGADTAGGICAGVALEHVDNTQTGHTAGGKRCRVLSGAHFQLTSSGLTQASVGAQVKISDSGTVLTTTTNNVNAGRINEYVSATSAWVYVSTPGSGAGS